MTLSLSKFRQTLFPHKLPAGSATARLIRWLPVLCGATIFIMALCFTSASWAQAITLDMGNKGGDGGSVTGRVIQLVALMTVLSLAPSILVMTTSFTRIIVVLSFLRTAMGIQQTPPNSVMVSLALFLTLFIMQPTMQKAYDTGVAPLIAGDIDEVTAFGKIVVPFKDFMLGHVRQDDLKMFIDMSHAKVDTAEDTPLRSLIPAFMISELRRAFEMGFMLFLPFLIIDMVTASILMSMGMMMLPPVMISLPFKIIFFVLVDGWHLICGTLVQSFGTVAPS